VDVRQLEHFVAVAEERHFTRAATRCHLSQSALSASVRALERELGAALLVRTTRFVEMTPAGEALLDDARAILALVDNVRVSVSAANGSLRGLLRVGGAATDGVIDIASLLAAFRERHPDVELRFVAATSPELIESLRAGELELVFALAPSVVPRQLEVMPLAEVPLHLVCRRDHPRAGDSELELDALVAETFVHGPAGSIADEVMQQLLPWPAPRSTLQAGDTAGVVDFVARGLGITVLPEYAVPSHPELTSIPLAGDAPMWSLAAMTPRDKPTAVTTALLEVLKTSRA
jgi:DNA-binding transcriptional LysR family regulator